MTVALGIAGGLADDLAVNGGCAMAGSGEQGERLCLFCKGLHVEVECITAEGARPLLFNCTRGYWALAPTREAAVEGFREVMTRADHCVYWDDCRDIGDLGSGT